MKNYSLILSLLAFNFAAHGQFTSDMTYTTSDGQTINPSVILQEDKYIYLDFFSTSCGLCNSVASEINNAYSYYGQNSENIFFIGVDSYSSAADCESFKASHGSEFPVIAGQEGGASVFTLFNQTGYPSGVLLDPSGNVVTTFSYASIATLTESLGAHISPLSDCELIDITSISLNTQTNEIDMEIYVNSNYLYSYPSFLILNSSGDTLATEDVFYYGLSGVSTHSLSLVSEFYLWDEDIELQLFSGFYETMECSSPISKSDIAYVGCTDPYAGNYNYNALVDNGSCLYAPSYFIASIDLDAGWNLVGYSCPTSADVMEAFAPYINSLVIVKDYLGNAYLPEWGFNGIGNLEPGYGYQLKINESIDGFVLCP